MKKDEAVLSSPSRGVTAISDEVVYLEVVKSPGVERR